MTTLTFCILETGQLPEGIKETLKRLVPSLAGKKVRLSLDEAKDKRSLDQNAYYRGYVLPHVRDMMYEAGDTRSEDAWHEELLIEFAPRVESTGLRGNTRRIPKRTRFMNVQEMTNFINAIIAECAIRGNPVPLNELQWEESA